MSMASKENRRLTSVTVHVETFKKIKRFADPINLSAAKFVELLISEYEKNPIPLITGETVEEIIYPRAVEWKWPGPYTAIIADKRIKEYRSTEWIRTKEYIDRCGPPFTAIDQRIRDRDDAIRVSKICVVSREAWDEQTVWNWIGGWLQYRLWGFDEKVFVHVIRQDVATRALRSYDDHERYFDMGIYDKLGVGFLKVTKDSSPSGYTQRWTKSEIEVAGSAFEKLREMTDELKDLPDLTRLQAARYDKSDERQEKITKR